MFFIWVCSRIDRFVLGQPELGNYEVNNRSRVRNLDFNRLLFDRFIEKIFEIATTVCDSVRGWKIPYVIFHFSIITQK